MKSFQAQTHYELLEVSVTASAADIRNAYERLVRLYADEQVALYGLIDEDQANGLRAKLKDALGNLPRIPAARLAAHPDGRWGPLTAAREY